MSWHQVLYAAPLFFVAAVSVFFLGSAWRKRHRTFSREDLLFLAFGAIWALAAAMETSSTDLRTAAFWCQLQLISITPIPWILWLYTLRHTQQEEYITPLNVILLGVVPIITLVLILTNDAHGLIVRQRELRTIGNYMWLYKDYGLLFIVFMAYLGLSIVGACSAIVRRMIKVRRQLFLWRPITVMSAFLIAATAGVAQITVLPHYNVASLAYVVCVVLGVQAVLPVQRLDLVPVAWKLVVEGMDDAVLVLNAEHRLVDLNARACALIGATRGRALGHTLDELSPGSKSDLATLLTSEQSVQDVVLGQGQKARTFNASVSPLRDAQGLLVSLVLVLRDISDRQEAELALRRYHERLEELVAERTADLQGANRELEKQIAQRQVAQTQLERSEERFQTLFEHAPEAYYLSDLKGNFVDGNEAAEQLVGYPRGELVGRSFLELGLLSASQVPKAAMLLARNMLGQKTGPDEFLLRHPDGTQVPVEISTHPIKIAGQTVVLGTAHDLRERKRTEEALRRAHDELELRVRERTAELARTNDTLQNEVVERRRAEEQLRASLTEKEVLLKEIHHRVKNNLQIISSLLSLQAADLQEPHMLAMFAESEHRVRSMALIHEKLYRSNDLARINFREYAEDLLQYLHRSYADAWGRIQLRVDAEDVLLTVESAVPCGLLLNELVNNCFKHAFPDGREGSITVGIHANGDGRVHLSVADDGVGLPAGFNVAETTSLGMQLVNTLTEQLDAELKLVSQPGTTVSWAFRA